MFEIISHIQKNTLLCSAYGCCYWRGSERKCSSGGEAILSNCISLKWADNSTLSPGWACSVLCIRQTN